MVSVQAQGNAFIFKLKGFHVLWALKRQITVPKNTIVAAYQDLEELQHFRGIRLGTYVPFLLIAGTYFLKGKRNFWDVSKEKNTIIVALQGHWYSKLYIEVENPEATMRVLNTK